MLSFVNTLMGNISSRDSTLSSNLLLILSDGRGLYLEGSEIVKAAVRRASEKGIFIVFIIMDNPLNKVYMEKTKYMIF